MPFHSGLFGSGETDVGWAGAFVPMVVSEETLKELRNLAGPPAYPGQRMVEVNLMNGEFKWKTSGSKRGYSRRSRRNRR